MSHDQQVYSVYRNFVLNAIEDGYGAQDINHRECWELASRCVRECRRNAALAS